MNPETFAKLRRQAQLQVRGREAVNRSTSCSSTSLRSVSRCCRRRRRATCSSIWRATRSSNRGAGSNISSDAGCPATSRSFARSGEPTRAKRSARSNPSSTSSSNAVARYPAMHVYHYASYEKSALRRLAQEHRTREDEVDDLLRDEVLVDLYAVVRRALVDLGGRLRPQEASSASTNSPARPKSKKVTSRSSCSSVDARRRPTRSSTTSKPIIATTAARRIFCASGCWHAGWRPRPSSASIFRSTSIARARRASRRKRKRARRSDLERRLLENVLLPKSEEEYRVMGDDRAHATSSDLLAYHRGKKTAVVGVLRPLRKHRRPPRVR